MELLSEEELEAMKDKETKELLGIPIPTTEAIDPKIFFSAERGPGTFVPEKLALIIMSKIKFLTMRDNEDVYWYNEKEGIWQEQGETKIKELGKQLLGDMMRNNYLTETIVYIKTSTYIDRKIFDDCPLNLLPVKNGILNLETKELLPYTPDYYFTSKLDVKFNPEAKCPTIERFLSEIVAPDDVVLLKEIPGYCLWRKYSIQKAFLFTGGGANGKSTYLSLIAHLLGMSNVSSVSLQDLGLNRFASANLYRKFANIYADLPNVALKNPGMFKMLVGGDLIDAERKFKDKFHFFNYAKLLFSANRVPYVEDESEAFYRRWVMVNFPNQFQENDPKTDKDLIDKLTTEEEFSGFLNIALENLRNILNNHGFSYHKTTDEIREEYIRASDPIGAFVYDCIVESPEDFEEKEVLFNAYLDYCREKKMIAASNPKFHKDFRKFVAVVDYRPQLEDGRRPPCWKGIKLIAYVKPVKDVKVNGYINVFDKQKKLNISDDVDKSDYPDGEEDD